MTGNTLHACLRLVLRLTRDFKYSQLFVSLGGVNLLMALDDSSNFPGLLGLISLIVRHCLEDDAMLKRVVEKVGLCCCLPLSINPCKISTIPYHHMLSHCQTLRTPHTLFRTPLSTDTHSTDDKIMHSRSAQARIQRVQLPDEIPYTSYLQTPLYLQNGRFSNRQVQCALHQRWLVGLGRLLEVGCVEGFLVGVILL